MGHEVEVKMLAECAEESGWHYTDQIGQIVISLHERGAWLSRVPDCIYIPPSI